MMVPVVLMAHQQMLDTGGRGTACACAVVNGQLTGLQKPDIRQQRYKNEVKQEVGKVAVDLFPGPLTCESGEPVN